MKRLVAAPNLALATLWADLLCEGGMPATLWAGDARLTRLGALKAALQGERRGRHQVAHEGALALLLEGSAARGDQRVARHRERQLVEDHQAQRVTRHVHALPEAQRGEQHRVVGLTEALEQRPLGRLALHEDGLCDHPRAALGQQAHRAHRRAQHEGAATGHGH